MLPERWGSSAGGGVVGVIFIILLAVAFFIFGDRLFNRSGGTQINVTAPKS